MWNAADFSYLNKNWDFITAPISLSNLTDKVYSLDYLANWCNYQSEICDKRFQSLLKIDERQQITQFIMSQTPLLSQQQDLSNLIIPIILHAKEYLTGLLFDKGIAIQAKICTQLLRARKDFLETHKDILISLFNNYYKFTIQRPVRYKDITHHVAMDLMPSDFYFGSNIKPQFVGSFAPLAQQFVILPNEQNFFPLQQAINAYHAIPKTNITNLQTRIKALQDIAFMAANLLKTTVDTSVRDLLQSIVVRANLKANYLQKLPALREEAFRRANGRPREVGNSVVNSKVIEDMLTDLDPEKRVIAPYYYEWDQKVHLDSNKPDFFLWLEGQDTSMMRKDLKHIFLTIEKKQVRFQEDGTAYNRIFRDPMSNHVSDGTYLFNISEDGELYILPDIEIYKGLYNQRPTLFQMPQYTNNNIMSCHLHHNTVMGGINLLCTGSVSFKKGRIISINIDSGHYVPLGIKHLKPALEKLSQKHPNAVSPDTEIQL